MTDDVFLLVFDSLRRDHIEPYSDDISTPALSRLAADSFVLEEAYSTGSWTIPAHGSLFTGKYPSQHGATGATKRLPSGPKTLAEVATNNDYEPIAISTNPWVSPDFGFYRGFGELSEFLYPTLPFPEVGSPDDVIDHDKEFVHNLIEILRWSAEKDTLKRLIKTVYDRYFFEEKTEDATVVTDHLLSSIESVPDRKPVFGFANYMDAHEPYFKDERNSQISWNLYSVRDSPKIDPNKIRDAYISSISSLDEGVSNLINGLQKQDRYDDALIIGVSDHGQSLGEHNYWGHGTYLYDELLRVPAFIKPPGGRQSATSIQQPFSLRKVFELASQAFSGDIDVEAWIRNSTEKVVVAESAGPHMDVELSSDDVSINGYWKFYGESWSVTKDLDLDEFTVCQAQASLSKTDILGMVDEAIKNNGITVMDGSADDESLDTDIERRLEHLGYK
ncbi:sulfatase [Halogeometricum borinquense]|uniref:sulfatase n=1 Tax=Halogeometricum borinquense TaxID=60847 RepID=UPI00343D27CD